MATEQERPAAYRAFLERDHPGAWVRGQQTAAAAAYVGIAEQVFNAGYDAGAATTRERARERITELEHALQLASQEIGHTEACLAGIAQSVDAVDPTCVHLAVDRALAAPPRPEPARREGE